LMEGRGCGIAGAGTPHALEGVGHLVGAFEVQDGARDRQGGLIAVAARLEVVDDLMPLQRIFPEVLLDVAGGDGNDVVEILRCGGGAHDDERYDRPDSSGTS